MHPHVIRLVVPSRHYHRRTIPVSVERQHESAVVDEVPVPSSLRRLVADNAQALTGTTHATPPFDQHAATVLFRDSGGPNRVARGIADKPIADHKIELMMLGARALIVKRLRGE